MRRTFPISPRTVQEVYIDVYAKLSRADALNTQWAAAVQQYADLTALVVRESTDPNCRIPAPWLIGTRIGIVTTKHREARARSHHWTRRMQTCREWLNRLADDPSGLQIVTEPC